MVKSENGFTLVEMLLTIGILSTILLLAAPVTLSAMEEIQVNSFIRVFTSDVLYLQATSRTTPNRTLLRYEQDDHSYQITSVPAKETLRKRKIPETFEFDLAKYEHLRFNIKGNVAKLGKIRLRTKHHGYDFIFSLGKGRFRIEKR